MKNISLSILALCACAFFACKKNKNAATTVRILAQVNSIPWVSSYATANLSKQPGTQITIDADSSNTHMQVHIGNYTGVGTYTITDTGNTAYYTSYSPAFGKEVHKATGGTIKIIPDTAVAGNNQTEIRGTFSFSADAITVQNGSFDVYMDLD